MTMAQFTSPQVLEILNPNSGLEVPNTCVWTTHDHLPDLIGRIFIDKIFAKEAIADMEKMIVDLKEAFGLLLDENQWIDKETLVHAKKKLAGITPHVAFPPYQQDDKLLTQNYMEVRITRNTNTASLCYKLGLIYLTLNLFSRMEK